MCGAAGEGLTRTLGTVVPRAGLRLVVPASPTRAQGSPGCCLLPSFSCAHSGSSLVGTREAWVGLLALTWRSSF